MTAFKVREQHVCFQTGTDKSLKGSIGNDRRAPTALENVHEPARRMNGEHDYRNSIVASKRYRGRIHDGQAAFQHFLVRKAVVARRVRHFLRIGRIDAIDVGALEERVAAHFGGPQCRAGIGREEWIACAADKNDDFAVLKAILGGTLIEQIVGIATAESTRALTPLARRASASAKPFMTVASMPM